jgi:hypothetical protein
MPAPRGGDALHSIENFRVTGSVAANLTSTLTLAYHSRAGRQQSEQLSHFCSICPRGSRPISTLAVVRLGVAGLDGDARSPFSADTAYRVAYLRHRHRGSSLAAMPSHRGRELA